MTDEFFTWSFKVIGDRIIADVRKLSMFSMSHLLIWGDSLYRSSNGGVSFYKMKAVSNITHLVMSNSGTYVFQKQDGKVFYSVFGHNDVREIKLERDPSWAEVGMFFSSKDELELLQVSNTLEFDCFRRRAVTYSEFHAGSVDVFWEHLRGVPTCTYMGMCHSEILQLKFQRHCPFREIVVSANNLQYFKRLEKQLDYRTNTLVYSSINDINKIRSDLFSVRFDSEKHAMLTQVEDSIDIIWLDLNECFEMTLQVHLNLQDVFSMEDYENEFSLNLKEIRMIHHVLHSHLLDIRIQKYINYLIGTVTFQIRLCCKGHMTRHELPGIIQHLNSIQFQVLPSLIDCFGHVKAFHSIIIRHGCPARKTIFIDFPKSKRQHRHFCEEENCFHFDKIFQPVFILLDEATGIQTIYNGTFQLTVVGGGPSATALHLYNDKQIHDYNFRPGGTLIWVWSSSQKSGQWLCGMSSPCAGIKPIFPKTPEYHFLLQFSNRESVESNCDYNFHFTLKLHGIPPDGIYPSLFIVLLTIAIISLVIFSLFVLEVKYPDFFPAMKRYLLEKNNKMILWFKRKKNKVGVTTSGVFHSKVLNWMHRNDKHFKDKKSIPEDGEKYGEKSTSVTGLHNF